MKKAFIFVLTIISFMGLSANYIKSGNIQEVKASSTVQEEISKPAYKTVTYYDVPLDLDFQDYLREECNKNNVELELVLAVMKVESNYNSEVISSTADHGIMQINECNHENLRKKLNIDNYLDPYQNAKAGIYMLSNLSWCENDIQRLMCYNMGVTGAKRAWNKGIYETGYTRKVLQAKSELGGKQYEIKILCDKNCK